MGGLTTRPADGATGRARPRLHGATWRSREIPNLGGWLAAGGRRNDRNRTEPTHPAQIQTPLVKARDGGYSPRNLLPSRRGSGCSPNGNVFVPVLRSPARAKPDGGYSAPWVANAQRRISARTWKPVSLRAGNPLLRGSHGLPLRVTSESLVDRNHNCLRVLQVSSFGPDQRSSECQGAVPGIVEAGRFEDRSSARRDEQIVHVEEP